MDRTPPAVGLCDTDRRVVKAAAIVGPEAYATFYLMQGRRWGVVWWRACSDREGR